MCDDDEDWGAAVAEAVKEGGGGLLRMCTTRLERAVTVPDFSPATEAVIGRILYREGSAGEFNRSDPAVSTAAPPFKRSIPSEASRLWNKTTISKPANMMPINCEARPVSWFI